MTTVDNPEMLMRYLKWSNGIFYAAVAKLPRAELTRNRDMLYDTILGLLNHVFLIQSVWKTHLDGTTHNLRSRRPTDQPQFDDLRIRQAQLDDWYIEYARGLLANKCDEIVDFEFIGGGAGAMTRHEVLNHVVNHAVYHRGHIEGVFYQIAVEPPTTDLPVFLRDVQRRESVGKQY